MNKKIVIILAFFLAAFGIIITGLIGENASDQSITKAQYCEFDVENESVNVGNDGRKYLLIPDIKKGEEITLYLNDYIRYDEEATKDISEIDVVVTSNHEDFCGKVGLLGLKINATTMDMPDDLAVTIVISTNDGSNLTDTIYIVNDPSNIPIIIDEDF